MSANELDRVQTGIRGSILSQVEKPLGEGHICYQVSTWYKSTETDFSHKRLTVKFHATVRPRSLDNLNISMKLTSEAGRLSRLESPKYLKRHPIEMQPSTCKFESELNRFQRCLQ